MKDTDPKFPNKIRVVGADEPRNPLEILKIQYENFSIF